MKRTWMIAVASVAGVLVSAGEVVSQVVAGATLAERVGERVKKEMEAQQIVGLAVGLARGEEVVFTGAWGLADREKGIAATEQTMFRWASVSKPMTAVVAMQLAGEGKLDLDADVRGLVSEFPEKPWVVTTRQLLCHQGGVVHYSNGPVVMTQRVYEVAHPFKDAVVALDRFRESPLVAEPETMYAYTTHGYMLVGAVVQRAAGKAFAEVVSERIARPLGMTTLRPDYQWEKIPNRTKGYRRKGDAVVASTDTDVSWKLAGGGWISNVEDMARFGAGMLGEKLVDAGMREKMWTAQRTRDGKGTGYGLGFDVRRRGGALEVGHSGSQEKTATYLLIYPGRGEAGVAVAVVCNTEGTGLKALAVDLAGMMEDGEGE